MEKQFRSSSNKSLFSRQEQDSVINSNKELLDLMKQSTSIKEWNLMRDRVTREFKGSDKEMLMLFGYIDGVLFQKMFKK